MKIGHPALITALTLAIAFHASPSVAQSNTAIQGVINEAREKARTAAAKVDIYRVKADEVTKKLGQLKGQMKDSQEIVQQWSSVSQEYSGFALLVKDQYAGCLKIMAAFTEGALKDASERVRSARKQEADSCMSEANNKKRSLQEIAVIMDSIQVDIKDIEDLVKLSGPDVERLENELKMSEAEARLANSIRQMSTGVRSATQARN